MKYLKPSFFMPNYKKPRHSFPFKRGFRGVSYSNTLNDKPSLNHGNYLEFALAKASEGQNISSR